MTFPSLAALLPFGGVPAAQLALTVLSAALSVAVTVHVLLRKRDIGASIGWIGLAWLTPLLGSTLYYLLGINRVRQRARRLKGRASPVLDGPFPGWFGGRRVGGTVPEEERPFGPLERTGFRITRRPTRRGNAVSILHNGDAAYPRMLAAIDSAKVSIGLSSYIFRDDAAGAPFIEALARAAARGVAVRVLVDGIGSGYFLSGAYRRLRQAGVPAARFMHSSLPWRMPFLNLRSHKKILVVDGRLGFTGGLNIGAENLLRGHPKSPVRDIHFALEGPVVSQLVEAFAHDWEFATGEELPEELWRPAAAVHGPATARIVTSGPDQDLEKIEFLALQAISCARRSVLVMTPYFLPDDRLVTALALAALRGVAVDIIVPWKSNHRLVDWAMRAHVEPLLAAGCRIWQNPPPFDHSKLMVVDSNWSLVGSSNWDMRSLRLNFELDVEIYHAGMAAAVTAITLDKRGERITASMLEKRSLPVRLRDAAVRLLLPYI